MCFPGLSRLGANIHAFPRLIVLWFSNALLNLAHHWDESWKKRKELELTYRTRIRAAYPAKDDGRALLYFRRLFVVAKLR